jgi:hypothetical protein
MTEYCAANLKNCKIASRRAINRDIALRSGKLIEQNTLFLMEQLL